ncbi:MAG TPA: tRNA-guanine transglycosylase, partial [Candidatus Kapabacteria bacterium]
MNFTLLHTETSTKARAGILETAHSTIETPCFMPVGTLGDVKGLTSRDLWETGTRLHLANAYHLYLRPGTEIVREAGGLHKFANWQGSILTDSGGYQ